MKNLETVLEEIKQLGNYAVTVIYGEDVGADDLDIPQNKRKLKILASPVGFIGEVRTMWVGNLDIMQNFDFSKKPIEVSNPPKYEDVMGNGYYVWGTDRMIYEYMKQKAQDYAKKKVE